jgi:LysM repeat protein
LGRHSKPSRIRIPDAAVVATGPALVGVAAAVCLSPQAASAAPVVGTAVQHSASSAADQFAAAQVHLLAATMPERKSAARRPARSADRYTVRSGDTLSAIAGRVYHNSAAWPVLYWGNRGSIKWADVITAGQVLRIPAEPAKIPAAPAQLAPAAYTPRHASTAVVPAQPATVPVAPAQPQIVEASDSYPGGAFGQCVVERESGGNPQVMNASGHYGLYQFSASTWAAYGGNPAEFGDASVAEQNQVFANALAQGGEDNWAPYDGC